MTGFKTRGIILVSQQNSMKSSKEEENQIEQHIYSINIRTELLEKNSCFSLIARDIRCSIFQKISTDSRDRRSLSTVAPPRRQPRHKQANEYQKYGSGVEMKWKRWTKCNEIAINRRKKKKRNLSSLEHENVFKLTPYSICKEMKSVRARQRLFSTWKGSTQWSCWRQQVDAAIARLWRNSRH